MIHPEEYHDFLTVENGHVVRTVIATWTARRYRDGGNTAVYRIDDTGKEECRCLYFNCYSGYLVDDSELANPKWYTPFINLNKFRYGDYLQTAFVDSRDTARICGIYPDFRYVLEKAGGYVPLAVAMRLLIEWKKNPKVELLLAASYRNLMYNGAFSRMTPARQKAVLAFIRSTEDAKYWNINKLLFVMNRKGTPEEFDKWTGFRGRYGEQVRFQWFRKYGANERLLDLYRDYARMAECCGHDMNEDYWKWPRDIKKAHDKVMAEYNLVLEAERQERRRAESRRERERRANFKKVAELFSKATARMAGLKAYIPRDIKAVRAQAKALHQCLVTADYIGEMSDRRCLLVFIADSEGRPVATAEITPAGKIGQFYGDEKGHDIEAMKPGEDAVKVLNKWLGKFKKDAVKAMKEAA